MAMWRKTCNLKQTSRGIWVIICARRSFCIPLLFDPPSFASSSSTAPSRHRHLPLRHAPPPITDGLATALSMGYTFTPASYTPTSTTLSPSKAPVLASQQLDPTVGLHFYDISRPSRRPSTDPTPTIPGLRGSGHDRPPPHLRLSCRMCSPPPSSSLAATSTPAPPLFAPLIASAPPLPLSYNVSLLS